MNQKEKLNLLMLKAGAKKIRTCHIMKLQLSKIFQLITHLLKWQKWRLKEMVKIKYLVYQNQLVEQVVQLSLTNRTTREEQKHRFKRKCVIVDERGLSIFIFY